MRNDHTSTPVASVPDYLPHVQQGLEQLNSRIARLAIALGVSLHDAASVQQALKDPPGAHEDAASAMHGHGTPQQRRAAQGHAELRGLLVLRYEIESKLSEELGADALQHMLRRIEQHMEREGFAHGADGVELEATPPSGASAATNTGTNAATETL